MRVPYNGLYKTAEPEAGLSAYDRYNSEYAARISTGAWKAKKHKAMAEEAQRAWAQLKSERGGRVWMRHVAKIEPLYLRASVLAAAGKHGTRTYAETVS